MLKNFPAAMAALTIIVPNSAFAQEPADAAKTEAKQSTAEQAPAEDTPAEAKQAENETWESEKRQAALRIQLFLDNEGFGPGKIDGRWGGFSKKAADRWNESANTPKIVITEGGDLDLSKTKEIPSDGEMTTTYEVTDKDKSILGTVPDGPEAMSKLKELPYTSLMELVAEKFHADPDFIRELNGLDAEGELEVGKKVKVPNVSEPFDISVPMELAKAGGEKGGGNDSAKGKELTVLRDQRVVEVREEGKLIHSFPITPGANDNRSPEGDWKVSVVSWMPDFRWDKSMLEDGTRSDDSFLLPPGPNNPVGIVWIGISADGIGLHGTPYPDAIGRNRSHGCIRLSNWDALKLAKAVTPGTPVTVK